MSVYRRTTLPVSLAIGRLIVAEQCLIPTLSRLKSSQGSDGTSHEGLVFWLGRTVGTSTLVLSVGAPKLESTPGSVRANEDEVGQIARSARAHMLGVVAQVHSHPGFDTRHSDGDDKLVFMPFHGMFSLVVADYGNGGLTLEDGVGLHQYQRNRWVQIKDPSAIIIVPSFMEGDR
jgi:proteasome lid subunit RPN8/RPN11